MSKRLKPHSPCQSHTAHALARCLSRRNLLHWTSPHLRPVDQVVHEPDPRSGTFWPRCHSWGENPHASNLVFLCTCPCSLHTVPFTVVRMRAGVAASRSRSRRPGTQWSRWSLPSTPKWSTRPAERPFRSQEDVRSQRHGQQGSNANVALFARLFYSLGRWYSVRVQNSRFLHSIPSMRSGLQGV